MAKILGIKFASKLSLFIWKVLHRIITGKDALIRRKINIDPSCPRCQHQGESIEHLFFQCIHSKVILRHSPLGLDFSQGTQTLFNEWWSYWMENAPSKTDIYMVAAILWII